METTPNQFAFEAENPAHLGQTLAALRAGGPVFYDPQRGYWLLLRHRDIKAAYRNPEVFSNAAYRPGPIGDTFVAADGEAHARHRRIFNHVFAPRAIQRFRERVIGPIAQDIVGRLAGRGSCELVSEFCLPLPIEIIAALLGMTSEQIHGCLGWVGKMIHWNLSFHDVQLAEAGRRARQDMKDYLRPLIEAQLRQPGDNLMGDLIRGYGAEGPVDPELMVTLGVGLVMGGYETTGWMMAGALGALLLHPQALARVQADRSLLMPAVEESMRWANSIMGGLRIATRDVTIEGTTIPAGSVVLLCSAAARYDEEAYPRPEVFDIDRRPEHLTFSPGPHFCLGAPLARMEAEVGLSMLLDRLRGLRLDPAAEQPRFRVGVRGSAMHGPHCLRVRYDADVLAAAA